MARIMGSGLNNRMVGSMQNDVILGYGGNDTLVGGGGFDRLYGGQGNDVLNSGAGDGIVSGGSGSDVFRFTASGTGKVTVTDFADDRDTLVLDRDFFEAGMTIRQILREYGSSSGGDSAIALNEAGSSTTRIVLLGVDNIMDLANDIVLI